MKLVNDKLGRKAASSSRCHSLILALEMVVAAISLTAIAETQTRATRSDFTSGQLSVLSASTAALSVNLGAIRIDIPPGAPSFSAIALSNELDASGTLRTAMSGEVSNSGGSASTDEGSVIIHGSLSGNPKESEDAPWRHWLQ